MTGRSNEYRIEIANEQTRPFDGERLIAAVSMILKDQGIRDSEISIAIVDDPTMRQLNCTYLGHDYETDVISFVLESDPEIHFLTGQLIVSLDTAAAVAAEISVPTEDELILYVVHGTLHLVGFDDKTPELAQKMRAAEKDYLRRIGIPYHWPPADVEVASNQEADS